MKLLAKYNRINLLSTIVIFALSGIAFYFVLQYTLVHQLDEDLEIEQREIISYVNEYTLLPKPIAVKDQQITFIATSQPLQSSLHQTLYSKNNKEPERELVFSIKAGNTWYTVSVKKSLEGTDNIIRSVVLITLCTILLILLATFLINRTIVKNLWKPFYHSLGAITTFKVGSRERPVFPESHIEEFALMNQTLERTTAKALHDYDSLRKFTENASHELQTPLAIIRSKLEVLMQGENLSEQQSLALQGATEAINRLSRLNQSLLLLTKIENEQFSLKLAVNLAKVVKTKIEHFKEIWQAKQIKAHCHCEEATIFMNQELLELLLNNLFSNATRHNYKNGEIAISLQRGILEISNTGSNEALNEAYLFQRFYNPSNTSSSTGLGLAVIKEICNASGISIRYHFKEGMHIFTVHFDAAFSVPLAK